MWSRFASVSSVFVTDALWRQGNEVFKISKLAPQANSRIRCAGCPELLTESPPYLGLVVIRIECDYQHGSRKLTPQKPRHHHMLTSCVRRRHPNFDPKGPNQTTMLGRWLSLATSKEEWVALFKKGDVD